MAYLSRICFGDKCSDVNNNFYSQEEVDALLAQKQDTLTAGENITIENGEISATDTTYANATQSTAGLMSAEDKTKLDGMTPADYLTCETLLSCQQLQSALDEKQDVLTAGDNIQIENGTISATDTTYENATQATAGLMSAADKTKLDGMTPEDYLTCENVLDCQTVSDAFDAKQDTLTAGVGIDITDNVVSTTLDTDVFVPVTTLPDPSTASANKIYLKPKDGGGVEEWHVIDVDGTPTWDLFGEEEIDLSGYLKCEDLAGCQTIIDMTDEIAAKQDALTAGENIQIAQDGTISATDTTYENATTTTAGLMSAADKTKLDSMTPEDYLTCDTVLDCQSVSDALDAKQDVLTAGSHITIAQDGTISAECCTKEELLAILGYEDQTISKTDSAGNTVVMHVLGYIEQQEAPFLTFSGNEITLGDEGEYPLAYAEPTDETTLSTGELFELTVENAELDGSPITFPSTVQVTTIPNWEGYVIDAIASEYNIGLHFVIIMNGDRTSGTVAGCDLTLLDEGLEYTGSTFSVGRITLSRITN